MCMTFRYKSFESALALLQRSNTCPEQEVQRLWMLLSDSLSAATGALEGPNLDKPEGAKSTLGRMAHLVPTSDLRVATNYARMDELLQQARSIVRDLSQRAAQLHALLQEDLRSQRAAMKAAELSRMDEKPFSPAKEKARPANAQPIDPRSLRVNRVQSR